MQTSSFDNMTGQTDMLGGKLVCVKDGRALYRDTSHLKFEILIQEIRKFGKL